MKSSIRLRFWLESGLAVVTGVLFAVTLVWPNWIEIAFRVDPDSGGGSLEWLIVGGLFVATCALVVQARYEWRRAHAALV